MAATIRQCQLRPTPFLPFADVGGDTAGNVYVGSIVHAGCGWMAIGPDGVLHLVSDHALVKVRFQ